MSILKYHLLLLSQRLDSLPDLLKLGKDLESVFEGLARRLRSQIGWHEVKGDLILVEVIFDFHRVSFTRRALARYQVVLNVGKEVSVSCTSKQILFLIITLQALEQFLALIDVAFELDLSRFRGKVLIKRQFSWAVFEILVVGLFYGHLSLFLKGFGPFLTILTTTIC